jgi:hypothetical protein
MKARWAARRKGAATKQHFSEERWTHTCRPKKAVAVDEGSAGRRDGELQGRK